jgi:uncharacterized membrane protein YqhA
MVAHTVGSIDGFLLATILLIFALGLYELFISDIDEALIICFNETKTRLK